MKINLNQLLSNIDDYDKNKIKETLGNNIIDENGVEYVYVQKYPIENYEQLDSDIKLWFENINGSVTGKTKENYKSLFSYLDSIEAEHIE